MSNFARSFKTPTYLSPRRRPALGGRSISNSSELSLTSTHSGRSDDAAIDGAVTSAPSTPTLPASGTAEDRAALPSSSSNTGLQDSTNAAAAAIAPPFRTSCSQPIAIQLPIISKINSSSVYTPPEPLSARGDLPGGYFPMHEDRGARIHRPHPFQQDANNARKRSIGLAAESASMHAERNTPNTTMPSSTAASPGVPIDPYHPSGLFDHPLPMGKYYPSNYEQRHNSQRHLSSRPSLIDSVGSSTQSDSRMAIAQGLAPAPTPASEAETRRRMQQYQRDMVAQATMALGGTSRAGAKGSGVSINGLPFKDPRYGSPMPHRPISPKLAPMGSPGPVTPMDLEAPSGGGGYLDKGRGPDRRGRDSLAPPGAGYTAHST